MGSTVKRAALLKPPPSWGVATHSPFVAAGYLEARSGTIYALELNRHGPRERISLAFVAHYDGARLSPDALPVVAHFAFGQLARGSNLAADRSRGVWPASAEFVDVRGRTRSHTTRRRSPESLADDLEITAHAMHPAQSQACETPQA